MDIALPSGKIIRGVPDGTNKEVIMQKAISAGLATEADFIGTKGYNAGTIASKLHGGAALGFGDELQALGAAAAAYPFTRTGSNISEEELAKRGYPVQGNSGFTDLYREARDSIRAEDKAFSESNPKTGLALDIGGGLLTGGAGLAKTAPKSLMDFAKFGAKAGAVGGLGYSESEDIPGMLIDTASGAAAGGVLGALSKPVGNLIGTGIRKLIPSAEQKASKQIQKELQRAGMTADEAKAHLTRNTNLILGDLSDNLQQRTASIATLPGEGAEKAATLLTGRARTQIDRIVPKIREGLGEDSRYLDAVAELQTSMKTRAKPLYEEAYKTVLEPTGKMKQLVDVIPKEAFKKAEKLAKTEFVDLDFDNLYDTRTLDYLMRGLSDIEGKQVRSGANQLARSLGNIRRELSSEIYEQNPAFKQARAVWSGGKADEEALEIGRKALRQDSESLRSQIGKMSESELKHFRIGVMKAIEDSVEGMSVNRDLVKKFRDVPKINKAIKAAFKDEDAYKGFMKMLDDEAAMMETYTKSRVGSRTTPLLESNAELRRGFFNTALRAFLTAGHSLKYDAATSAAVRLFKPIEEKNEAARKYIGDLLLGRDLQSLLVPRQQPPVPVNMGGIAAQGGLLGSNF